MSFRKQDFAPVQFSVQQSVGTVWCDDCSTAYLLVRQSKLRTSRTLEQVSVSALSVSLRHSSSRKHSPTSAARAPRTADALYADYGVVIWYKPLLLYLQQNSAVGGAHGFGYSSRL